VIVTSVLVFAIAFAVGCLSGLLVALWVPRRRTDKSSRAHFSSFWRIRGDEPTTVQRALRR
jgi:hypothetical protein